VAIRAVRVAVGANAALRDVQRRSDARSLLVRRHKVVCDVFDEDTLALFVLISFAGLAEFSQVFAPSVRCEGVK
jgi:hypothetical protein